MTHPTNSAAGAGSMPHKLPREPSWGDFHSATPTPPNEPRASASGDGLGEVDLLGSFDDFEEAPRRMSTPTQAGSASGSGEGQGKTTLSSRIQAGRARAASRERELDLINLDTDESGEVVPLPGDPHLQLYEGPSAELPSVAAGRGREAPTPGSMTTATTSTSSTSSLFRQRSSRRSSTQGHPIPHPPRRMSTIDALGSLAGPSSPAAVSPEAGDSFVFRAHAHDETHRSGADGPVEDAETGMRRLSISPTRSMGRAFALGGYGHGLPAVGGVGQFPRKRASGELRDRARAQAGKDDEGRETPRSAASGHERAATDPWWLSGEKGRTEEEPDMDEGIGRNAHASSSSSTGTGWKRGAATLGAKATQGIKSKWKTVLGPSTFTPSNKYDAFGVPYTATVPSLGGAGGFSQKELDAPSATAMPVETTHHTPFAPRHSGSWGYGIGSGSGSGSYIPPSGAPGFVPTNGWAGHTEEEAKVKGEWSGTKLVGRREGTFEVLDEDAADALRPFFPPRQRLSNKWTLLFSIDQHGASLSTFYRLIEKYSTTAPQAGNLLIIKDAQDRRFGVYMNEWIRRAEGTYTGSGESWLYKLAGHDVEVHAKVFKWTGRNHYFALCEGGFISFGGGDGKYGLYLDAALVRGSSATCPAYDNEVLCAEEGSQVEKARFECMGMEVWGT